MAKIQSKAPEIVEAVKTLLKMAEGPLHYKIITNIIVEAEFVQPYGKEGKFDQIVYSALHNEYKRNGVHSEIIFMGGGIFVHKDVEGVKQLELPEVKDNSHHAKAKEENAKLKLATDDERLARLHADGARCGKCVHIYFTGPDELTMRRGQCNCENTKANFVASSQPACLEFSPIGYKGQLARDKRKHDLQMKLMEFNVEVINFAGRERK